MAYSPLSVVGVLLPDTDGAQPRDRCPACGAERQPPGSDEGLPYDYQWRYRCDSGYWAHDEAGLADWRPTWPCFRVKTRKVLCWLRDATQDPTLRLAFTGLDDTPSFSPGKLVMRLEPIRSSTAPASCPRCNTDRLRTGRIVVTYACGAGYSVASTTPAEDGAATPTSFGGLGACERPPPATLLRALDPRGCEAVLERVRDAFA